MIDILNYCEKHHEHYWAGAKCRYCEKEDSIEPATENDDQGT